jgi:hypothetical protein
MADPAVNPPAAVRQADALIILALEINREHRDGELATAKGLEHYRRAGAALLKAQDECQRRQVPWLAWLTVNCPGVSERTAQRLMSLARESDGSKSDAASDLRQ